MLRAWTERYPIPAVATAAAVGVGAGVAVRSVLHHGDTTSNGAAEVSASESTVAKTSDAKGSRNQSAKEPGLVASTLRSLATGLAGAAAEVVVAATRQQLQATLSPPSRDKVAEAEKPA